MRFDSLHAPYKSRTAAFKAALLFLMTISALKAAPVFFTDSNLYATAVASLPASAQTQTFDGVPAGTLVPQGAPWQGITYSSNLAGQDLLVSTGLDTVSSPNYLGVDGRAANAFHSGDEFRFDMQLSLAFGLFVLSREGTVLENDFQLVAAGDSVFNSAAPERTLADGTAVYFLGVVDPDGFTSTQFISFGDPDSPFFTFSIDSVSNAPVPEPSTSLMVAGALGLLSFLSRRSTSRSRSTKQS